MTSVAAAIAQVLGTGDPAAKVAAARRVARAWRLGRLDFVFDTAMPDRPARPDRPELLAPAAMPKRKIGSEAGRIALIHALAHIEFVAIDLAFDMAGRFGAEFPRAFTDDWLGVGADEAMHFALLDRRLRTLGSGYGALPAHDGLWEAAGDTAHDVLARLAVVPIVLEARGLDVTPATRDGFVRAGDDATASILSRILSDEVRHVATGTKWFGFACNIGDSTGADLAEAGVRTFSRPVEASIQRLGARCSRSDARILCRYCRRLTNHASQRCLEAEGAPTLDID